MTTCRHVAATNACLLNQLPQLICKLLDVVWQLPACARFRRGLGTLC
jgi:hypothetical protein